MHWIVSNSVSVSSQHRDMYEAITATAPGIIFIEMVRVVAEKPLKDHWMSSTCASSFSEKSAVDRTAGAFPQSFTLVPTMSLRVNSPGQVVCESCFTKPKVSYVLKVTFENTVLRLSSPWESPICVCYCLNKNLPLFFKTGGKCLTGPPNSRRTTTSPAVRTTRTGATSPYTTDVRLGPSCLNTRCARKQFFSACCRGHPRCNAVAC